MTDALSAFYIYVLFKVLYFILFEDDFAIKSKIQSQTASCFEFVFYFILINCHTCLCGSVTGNPPSLEKYLT